MGISVLSENLLNGRDLAAARDAYQTRDADASKTAHTAGACAAGSRRHTLGSAPRHLRRLSGCGHLAALALAAWVSHVARPIHLAPSHTASVARTSRLQSRRFHRLWLYPRWRRRVTRAAASV